jgi:holo-ACP synthase CitX
MSFDASRRSLLAARDARQAILDRHAGPGTRVRVALSLAVPGAQKAPPGASALFAWGLAEAGRTLPGARTMHAALDALGPFALLAADGDPAAVKLACVAVESSRPAARLLDLDVLGPDGALVDRARLGLPPRACLACDAPAHECIRVARHDLTDVVRRARALLAAFPG